MQQILDLIISSLMVKARTKKIGDVIKDHMGFHNVDCTNEYDNYTVEQFLVLFKIDYLEYLKVIDEETSVSLKNLYLYRLELNRKMGDIAYKNMYEESIINKNKIQTLYEKVLKIDQLLSKYHLLINNDDYEMLFFTSIEKDKYENLSNSKEIKKLMKELKR